jgi:two-component system LytT family response regulator
MLIDDERLARAELRRLLVAHPDVEIVGEAGSAAEACDLIHQLTPDLLFLDVQMPGGTGFDLLASLERAPSTIFTTAFDVHAVQAFEVNALDYLLKPIRAERLSAAIHKVTSTVSSSSLPQDKVAPGKIFVKDGRRCWFVSPRDIFLLESEGNYTRVYFHDNRPLTLRSLQRFEETLDPRYFVRISRQHVVNVTHVVRSDIVRAGGMEIELTNGAAVQIARRRVERFKEVYLLADAGFESAPRRPAREGSA